jgi:hypothetical protein
MREGEGGMSVQVLGKGGVGRRIGEEEGEEEEEGGGGVCEEEQGGE